MATMDEYHELFAREHRFLVKEFKRIEQLLKDVMWFNFETVARGWKHPWPESLGDSPMKLCGQRYTITGSGRRRCEKASFPVYYEGTVCDAPCIPPEILLGELKAAYDDVKKAEESCSAPYEWAPGGVKYEAMLRESEGVCEYKKLSSNTNIDRDE